MIKEVYVSEIQATATVGANSAFWKKVLKLLGELQEGEELLLDFKDIELKKPWDNAFFKEAFSDPRLKFRLYNNKEVSDTLNVLCTLEGLRTDRVENVIIESNVKKEPKVRAAIGIIKNNLLSNLEENDDECIVKMYKAVSQLSYDDAYYAVKELMNERPGKHFVIELGNVVIMDTILKMFIGLDNCTLTSSDKKIEDRIRLYKSLKSVSVADKVRILREKCGINTVGTLYRYKDTKKKDEFGRKGGGEPISNRPAILRQIKSDKSGVYCVIEVFSANDFETNSTREARGEEVQDKLPSHFENIRIEELGFDGYFTGSLYHFNSPIHDKADPLYPTFTFNGEEFERKDVTLPKLIKMVFDEFGIDYNVTNLLKAIGQSEVEIKSK